MRNWILTMCLFCIGTNYMACQKATKEYTNGNISVLVKEGKEWKHNFPLFLGIKIKNTPQIAIWTEDMEGNYLSTLFVTHRTATQDWRMAKGNRRKESLPHWGYSRGVQYEDGLYLPTKQHALTDGISGATPKGSFDIRFSPGEDLKQFIVKIEINHSTDFNEYYTKDAKEEDPFYSGGKEGSGQPALVYQAVIDLNENQKTFPALLIGHSSPDGTDGEVYTDLSRLTTALEIVEEIVVSVQ